MPMNGGQSGLNMALYSPRFGIEYDHLPGSPQESGSWDSFTATCNYRVAWENRIRFYQDMLGFISGSTVYPAHQYIPEGNGTVYNVYAKTADIEPIRAKSPAAGITYKYARFTINYSSPDFDEPPEGETVYVTESLEPAAEFITLNRDGLYFGTGASKVSLKDQNIEPPAKIERMTDWVYTLHRVLTLPSEVLTLPGKINSAAVASRSLNTTWPALTLLCGNPSLERQITSTGVTAWTITFRFTYRNHGTASVPLGWQHFPRTDTVATGNALLFERITDGTDNIKIYEEASFAGLII